MVSSTKIECGREITRLKDRAFTANRMAKVSKDQARESFYRTKDAAINALLKAGWAFVDGVDWSAPDPTIGVRFVGGGGLHTKLSALDLAAFRKFRQSVSGVGPQDSSAWSEPAATLRFAQ